MTGRGEHDTSRAEVLEMLARGWSVRRTSRESGVPRSTVHRWCQEGRDEIAALVEQHRSEVARIYGGAIVRLARREIRIGLGQVDASPTQYRALDGALRRAGVVPVERVEISGALSRLSDEELEALIAGVQSRSPGEESDPGEEE